MTVDRASDDPGLPEARAGYLDLDFLDAFSVLNKAAYDEPRSGETLATGREREVARVSRDLERLCGELNTAVEEHLGPRAFGPRPSEKVIRDYVNKGERRTDDSVRMRVGKWNSEVKLIVELSPRSASVFLTSWVSSEDQSKALGQYFSGPAGDGARRHLIELSQRLEDRYGVRIHLQDSVRIGSQSPDARGWPDYDDERWLSWRHNPVGNMGVGLFLWPVWPDWVEEYLQGTEEQAFDQVGRYLGGSAGRWLAKRARAEGVALNRAVQRAVDQTDGALRRLMEAGKLSAMLVDAASGLAPLLADFRRQLPRSNTTTSLPFDTASPGDIVEAVQGVLNEADAARTTIDASDLSATLAWATGGSDAPSIEIRRTTSAVRMTFKADVKTTKYTSDFRRRVHDALTVNPDTILGLTNLISTQSGNLVARCGRRGCQATGCSIRTDLARHLFLDGSSPSLEWTVASDRGNPEWLSDPAQLLAGFFSIYSSGHSLLRLPAADTVVRTVFLSTPGDLKVDGLGTRIRAALIKAGISVWHMHDHYAAGSSIKAKTAGGVESAQVVVALLTEDYWSSEYCVAEFLDAVRFDRPIVPVVITQTGAPSASADLIDAASVAIREFARVDDDVARCVAQLRHLYSPGTEQCLLPGFKASGQALTPVVESARTALQGLEGPRPSREG